MSLIADDGGPTRDHDRWYAAGAVAAVLIGNHLAETDCANRETALTELRALMAASLVEFTLGEDVADEMAYFERALADAIEWLDDKQEMTR